MERMLLLALFISLANANLATMISQGLASQADVLAAVEAGLITNQQAQAALSQINQCPNGMHQNTIPRMLTPMPAGGTIGYGPKNHGVDEFEPEYLGCCTDPISDDIPDFTGTYAGNSPIGMVYSRIEQCGSRFLVAGNGVVHDWPAINDDETVLEDVSSMCVGMPSAFVDNPVASMTALGINVPFTCQQIMMAGGNGCSCRVREAKVRSNGNCMELYENPDEPEITWCKQDNGDIIRTMQMWVNGRAHIFSMFTFEKYVPEDAAAPEETSCPAPVQAMLDSGMTLAAIQEMIVNNNGDLDLSVLAACGSRRKM
jgi:hypothetical protein